MIKPLSPLKYFKENKKKAVIIFITLLLAVLSISFITCLIKSIFASSSEANIAPLKKFSWAAAPNGKMFIEKDVINKVSDMDSVDKIYGVMLNNTSLTTVFGNTSSPIIFINDDNKLKEVFGMGKSP